MTEYDSTNSGVIFSPWKDQMLSGQGKLNINGEENRYVLIYETISQGKPPVLVLYERAGVFFTNDKKGNEKAPDFSGPLDRHPGMRVAGWKGVKDDKKYISLKVSARQTDGEQAAATGNGWSNDQGPAVDRPGGSVLDNNVEDDIPF